MSVSFSFRIRCRRRWLGKKKKQTPSFFDLLIAPLFLFQNQKTKNKTHEKKKIRARIKYLQEIQASHDALEEDYKRELEALDAKYTKKYAPLFATRAKVVRGDEEAPAEIVEALRAELAEVEKEEGFAGGAGVAAANAAAGASDEPVPKGIPQFWLGAMRAHDGVASRITEKDEAVLEHLIDLRCEELGGGSGDGEGEGGEGGAATSKKEKKEGEEGGGEDSDSEEQQPREYGFRLAFVFEMPNPFFDSPADGVVTKTYHMAAEDEEGMLERAVGTRIAWKAGKDPTVKILKKKPKPGRKPGGASGKPMTKIEKTESFFNFFSPPAVPEEGDDDLDDEEVEALQEALEEDYELGETLRDELVPHAVSFYTGEMAEMDEEEEEGEDYDDDEEEDEDEDGDEDDDDDDDDDDEDDDDDDSEEEEEEERRAPSRGKQSRGGSGGKQRSGGKSGGGGAKGGAPQDTGEKPAECKQQ